MDHTLQDTPAHTPLAPEIEGLADATLDAMPGVFYVIDERRRLVRWNRNFEEVTGLSADQLRGVDCLQFIHEEDRPLAADRIRDGFEKGHAEAEVRLSSPHGPRWFHFTGKRMDVNGRQFLVGGGMDITDRKRAEDALLETEATTRALLATVPDLMFRVGADGTYLDCVANRFDELYVPPSQFLDRTMHEVLPRELADQLAECGRKALASGEVVICEYPLQVHGEQRHFEARVVTCGKDEVVQIIRDITDRKRAEEAAQQAEQKLRRFVEGNVIGVLVAGTECITEANDVFLKMVGRSRADLEAGRVRWPEMTPPEHAATDAYAVSELLKHGVCAPLQKEYFRPDGSRVPVLLGAAMLERLPFRAICFALDLTEQRRAEEQLRMLNDTLEDRVAERSGMVRRLLTELDHRVRNNLAGLLSLVEMMRQRAPGVEAFAAAMEIRLWAMARVHDLLAQGDWQPVELASLIASVIEAAGDLSPHRVKVQASGPSVVVSPHRAMPLSLALVEWFSNSCKYGAHSAPGGKLNLSWELLPADPGQRIRLRWRESGGPRIAGPIKPSLGMELVHGFVTLDLGGRCQMTFPETGADHTIEFSHA